MKEKSKMKRLKAYEKKEIKAIKVWKKKEPGVVSKAFGVIIEPVASFIQKVVPEAAIRGALDFSNSMAKWLSDIGDVKRDANVKNIKQLRSKNLELSDKLANEVHNWAIGLAVVEGGGTGFFGLPGMAADFPAIIMMALRAIHKIGICYGYEAINEDDKNFILGILSSAGANSVQEKIAALSLLRTIEVTIARQTWKLMAEKAAGQQMGKEAVIIAIRNLAKQLGINITKRRALAAIPIFGAIIGGSVNGWFIKEVGWAARRCFQERWLIDNHKIIEIK